MKNIILTLVFIFTMIQNVYAVRVIRAVGTEALVMVTSGASAITVLGSGSIALNRQSGNCIPWLNNSKYLECHGTVSSTEFGYLDGVTSSIQDQFTTAPSSALLSANIYVGNGSNVASGVAMSGDITITNSGATLIGGSKVLSAMIADDVIVNADINSSAAIAASKIADGTVNNTEFQYLSTVSSNVQSQIDGKVTDSGDAMTGNLTMNAQNAVRFADADSSNYVEIKATGVVASNVTLTLPIDDGNSGQLLSTDGNGFLSWATDVTTGGALNILAKGTSYSVQASDQVVIVNASTGVIMTLPTAVANTGVQLRIIKAGSSASGVTIDGNGSETIDGQTSVLVTSQYGVANIVSDGSGWYSLNSQYNKAGYFGSVRWPAITNCSWAATSASFANFGTDADCDDTGRTITGQYNVTGTAVAHADGQLPQIKFSRMPPGTYRIAATGNFFGDGSAFSCSWRFHDGTSGTSTLTNTNADATSVPVLEGVLQYTTEQGPTAIQIQNRYDDASAQCSVASNTNGRNLHLYVYYYPTLN